MLTLTTSPHLQVRRPSPTTAEFTVTTRPPATLSTRLLIGLVHLARALLALSALLLLHSAWTLPPFLSPPRDEASAAAVALPMDTSGGGGVVVHAQHAGNNNATGAGATADTTTIFFTTTTTTAITANDTAPSLLPAAAHAPHAHPPPSAPSPPPPPPPHPLPPAPSTLWTADWAPYVLARLHASPLGVAPAWLAARLPPSLLGALGLAVLYLTALRVHTTESLLVLRGLGIQTSSAGGSYLVSHRAGTRFIPTEKIRDVLINEAFRGFAVRYYLVVVVDGEDDIVVVFPRLLPGRRIVERVWRGCRGCLWEPQEGGSGGGGLGAVAKRVEEKGAYG